jgi:hypothetical protein
MRKCCKADSICLLLLPLPLLLLLLLLLHKQSRE